MAITLFGIKNCDTCRKACQWLETQGIDHEFHDLREDKFTSEILSAWLAEADWTELLNRRSTTWRNLDEGEKSCENAEQAMSLMLRHPTLVKRPVLARPEGITVGFSPARYAALFSGAT